MHSPENARRQAEALFKRKAKPLRDSAMEEYLPSLMLRGKNRTIKSVKVGTRSG